MTHDDYNPITFKKELIYPNSNYWSDILTFYVQLVEPDYPYFQELVSLLSYTFYKGELTEKQRNWLNSHLIPDIQYKYIYNKSSKIEIDITTIATKGG